MFLCVVFLLSAFKIFFSLPLIFCSLWFVCTWLSLNLSYFRFNEFLKSVCLSPNTESSFKSVFYTNFFLILGLQWHKCYFLICSLRSLRICSPFSPQFFSLCSSDWIIFVDLFSDSQTLYLSSSFCSWAHPVKYSFLHKLFFHF